METAIPSKSVPLRQIARVFLTIGTIGFGGGMAVIALIQRACVDERNWVSKEEFAHGVAFGQILGPFAVNTATFVGFRLRGWVGSVTAAISFIAPSVALVLGLSALYFHYHTVPALHSVFNGIGPVVVALIVDAAVRMGRGQAITAEAVIIALTAFVLLLVAHTPIVLILLAAALYGMARFWLSARKVSNG
jgi:chromate transporter